ncbi:methyltransferase pmt17 [Hordeum vulgare]|nr:methyltransferase pmt17 [Hordeum vulgare]
MAGCGSESFNSRSVHHELIPCGPKEEMVVRLALRSSREAAALLQHSDSQHRDPLRQHSWVPRSGVVATLEAVRFVWSPNIVADVQPLCWCAEDAPWASSDANMVWCACRASQRAREATEALMAVDIGEVELHSREPRIMHGCGRRNRIVVDILSSVEGSVIDLTSTGTVRVTASDEEE